MRSTGLAGTKAVLEAAFRKYYNQERPHEALQQRTPASCYQASPRVYTGKLKEPEYESGLETRKVQSNGSFN